MSSLSHWLDEHPLSSETLRSLQKQDFANVSLSLADAQRASEIVWNSRSQLLRKERTAEMEARSITIGDKTMPFWFKVFGDKPDDGRRLDVPSQHHAVLLTAAGGHPVRSKSEPAHRKTGVPAPFRALIGTYGPCRAV